MSRQHFRTDRFIFVIATMEMLQGLLMFALPQQFDNPSYDPVRSALPLISSLLLAGGVVLFMAYRYQLPARQQRVLVLLPAAPLMLLAWLFWASAVWTGAVHYGIVAGALLIMPWLPQEERVESIDWGALVLGLIAAVLSIRILIDPNFFAAPVYAPIAPWRLAVGLVGLLGAIGLGVAQAEPFARARYWLTTLGALLPVILFITLLYARIWTGLGWGLWSATFLLAALWDFYWTRHRERRPETEEGLALRQLERRLESWSWLLALALVFLTAISEGAWGVDPAWVTLFVIGISLYNLLAHFVFAHQGKSSTRVLVHLAFLAAAIGLLRVGTGLIGAPVLMILVIAPALATRARGERSGKWMLAASIAMVVPSHLYGLWMGTETWYQHVGFMTLEGLVLSVASWVGLQDAIAQRSLVGQLRQSQGELRQQNEKLGLLIQIAAAARSSLEMDQVVATTVRELGQALVADRCLLRVDWQAAPYIPEGYEYTAPGIPSLNQLGPVPSRPILSTEQTLVFHDLAADHDPELQVLTNYLRAVGVRAAVIAPIMVDGNWKGALVVHSCRAARAWQPAEIRLIEEVAMQVGVAMALAESHQELQKQYEALQDGHQELQSAFEELMAQEEELHELNAALRQSESRFSMLLSIAPNPIVALDQEHRILFFNQQAGMVFGYEEDEVLGEPLDILLPDQYIGQHAQYLSAFALDPAQSRPMGERRGVSGRRKNGAEFPAEATIAKFTLGDERYFIAIVQDVTQRNETERILRESEELFRNAFDKAPIGMALAAANLQWLRVNEALCKMLGYEEEEFLQVTVDQLVYEEDRLANEVLLKPLTAGEVEMLEVEARYAHKQGHPVWVRQSCSLIREEGKGDYFMLQIEDITERKRYEERLVQLANLDPLTGLLNRRRFNEEMESYLALARNFNLRGAVLLLDLDLFKYINDSLGHRAGDELLRRVATLLRSQARETDIVARLGGDEFAFLLPYTGTEAVFIAERILESLRQEQVLAGGRTLNVTCSIGITYFPDHGTTPEDLLSQADVAMYKAKEAGRNNYAIFTPHDDWREQIESKLSWDRRIREGLRHDRFTLYGQPIMDLQSGQVSRLELLLRLQSETGEIIPPSAFLGVAERYGLIQDIDHWVVRRAIRMVAANREAWPYESFEINLSGKTISDPGMLRLLEDELEQTGLDPACLVLEITETAAISDLEQARRFIKAMKGLGLRFALDDVGAGFSTLHLLKHLDVDYIKIDGGFVRNLPNDVADQHLVKALVAVAKSLGQKTIAEFVENPETLDLLREYGVDYAQGYLIGRPSPDWSAK